MEHIDDVGRTVRLDRPATRVVSLCPSVTETLFALKLQDEVVGRTRFCVHPAGEVKRAQNVGGTKKVDESRIDALQPDLILAVKEENTPEIIAALETRYPVYVFDVRTPDDALRMIGQIGAMCDRESEAAKLEEEIRLRLSRMTPVSLRYAYLIWESPTMAVGGDTFIDSLLQEAGWENVLSTADVHYPTINPEEIRACQPDVVFLSSEPYPFKEQHISRYKALYPECDVRLIDGEISWFGAHMRQSLDQLAALNEQIRKRQAY